MDKIIEFLQNIFNYIASAEVLGTISFGSIIAFIIQFFTKNWQIKKANAKYGAKSAEIDTLKEIYNKYVVDSEKTVEELKTEYLKATAFIKEISESIAHQNDALTTAFNNSNLNASAKRLVSELLAHPTATEIQKDDQLPIPNAVAEVVENEVIENEQRIKRVI